MEKFYINKSINPIISIISAVVIMFYSLFTSSKNETLLFLILVFLTLIVLGYYKVLFNLIPFLLFLVLVFVGVGYLTKKEYGAFSAFNRVFSIYISISISISIRPINLVRTMKQLKISKKLSLGALVTFSFIPKLKKELNQIKLAKKTRAVKKYKLRNIYRATIFPFITRLVDISEILSLSIETRGFNLNKNSKSTIYNKVKINYKDIVFSISLILFLSATIFFNVKGVKVFG